MWYLFVKAGLSGIIAMVVSEVARRSPGMGGLIASLPLVSVLGIIWLWRDTDDVERVAQHAESTFWFVRALTSPPAKHATLKFRARCWPPATG